jgi:hypothetical protein
MYRKQLLVLGLNRRQFGVMRIRLPLLRIERLAEPDAGVAVLVKLTHGRSGFADGARGSGSAFDGGGLFGEQRDDPGFATVLCGADSNVRLISFGSENDKSFVNVSTSF